MKTLSLFFAGMIAVIATAQVGAVAKDDKPDYAKQILGKWEVTKAPAGKLPPVGAVYEFKKDGKMKLFAKADPKEEGLEGDYNIVGDQLRFAKPGDKKEPCIILKMSDKELILGGKDDEKIELKRLP